MLRAGLRGRGRHHGRPVIGRVLTARRPGRLGVGWWILLLAWPAAVVLRGLAARDPARVEREFSRGLYPKVSGSIAWVTAWTPLSVAEVLVACALLGLVAWLAWAIRAVVRRQPGRAARSIVRLLAAAGMLYLAFLLQWGLNYHREPVASAMGLAPRPQPAAALVALGEALAVETNALRQEQVEDARGVMRLRDGVDGALARARWGFERAALRWPILSGSARPKAALSSLLLSYAAISGIYVPFTTEPHVNARLPEAEIPFTAGHELAHHLGFAREDEANFLAYVACREHPDADFRYSGALRAGLYVAAALRRTDPAAHERVEALRSEAVRRDLRAMAEWRQRYESRAADVQARINDAYLKAQGQRDGIASYGRMVDLLLAERAGGGR